MTSEKWKKITVREDIKRVFEIYRTNLQTVRHEEFSQTKTLRHLLRKAGPQRCPHCNERIEGDMPDYLVYRLIPHELSVIKNVSHKRELFNFKGDKDG